MWLHVHLSDREVFRLIKEKTVVWAGNRTLKIYGTLRCSSGKRMKKQNRVFFQSEEEALAAGYRACKHCLRNREQLSIKKIN
jgi:methylphosphotriester-DNA--protein-cysteine methyltransferase